MSSVAREGFPQDIVAIFHASFHPTQGNVIDWSLKASDDVDLNGVEFCCLPSGLHLIDHDVVYFTKGARHGVCVFRKRVTTEDGHRGFRLSSLGILLAESSRPRSWRHLSALKELVNTTYDSIEARGISEPVDSDWDPARQFFEERKVRTSDLSGEDVWSGWDQEFDGPDAEPSSCTPTLHLAHFLRLMGASILTLYKHVLGRRRILLYTQPPVEAACNFCQVAADMVYEDQVSGDPSQTAGPSSGPDTRNTKLKSKHQKGIKVLGMVTLHDIRKLAEESTDGRGWIACTTDALFLERPQYYDLIIDLTTSAVLNPMADHRSSASRLYDSHGAMSNSGPSSTASSSSTPMKPSTRPHTPTLVRASKETAPRAQHRNGRTPGVSTKTPALSAPGSGWAPGAARHPSTGGGACGSMAMTTSRGRPPPPRRARTRGS
ncbi:hypothetical protein EVG20_g933 [Dentipellis fragilis]|uniref:Protein LCHN n=1 Tax=Dentipellis fragilis TaxID=205917 RepID=A0A4Y9ZE26_9AGAM|nr:hypothetical protein EVG20_g933 [Dentipellis fragilis]